jgi:quercetin dioxygenase-like cupin family protein
MEVISFMKTVGLLQEPQHAIFPGVFAQFFSGKELMMMHVTLGKGAVAPAHSHRHEQMSVILKGKVSFTIGEETRELAAGDAVSIPGHAVHAVTALEDAELIEVFTPIREDFVERFGL